MNRLSGGTSDEFKNAGWEIHGYILAENVITSSCKIKHNLPNHLAIMRRKK